MRSDFPVRRRFGRRLAIGLSISAAVVTATLGCGGSPQGAPIRVVIPAGSTFRQATDSLARIGLVGQPRIFRIYAMVSRHDRNIKAGTYSIKRGTPWSEILTVLAEGRGIVRAVTIPEGWSLANIVPALARVLEVPRDSVDAAVSDNALRERLDVPVKTIEGYLFPDTYSFGDQTTARSAVEDMVRRFEQKWKPEWNARLPELAMTRHDIVTLASIIETEARLPEERPVISAVYHNRLRIGMLLQADPTVQYSLGRHTSRVMYRDLEVESKYNTYKYKGLPPGPIASPGAASIEAALFPADVPYLYFVAHPDGHHEFRRTLSEHNEARVLVRRGAPPSRPAGPRPSTPP
jgi:UPF0755 protein